MATPPRERQKGSTQEMPTETQQTPQVTFGVPVAVFNKRLAEDQRQIHAMSKRITALQGDPELNELNDEAQHAARALPELKRGVEAAEADLLRARKAVPAAAEALRELNLGPLRLRRREAELDLARTTLAEAEHALGKCEDALSAAQAEVDSRLTAARKCADVLLKKAGVA